MTVVEQKLSRIAPGPAALQGAAESLHPVLQRAGGNAAFAADEFFSACISNPHTRRAYGRAVSRFLDWCELQGLDLAAVTPGAAGRFIEELPGSAATKNQARAAAKQFCDCLVQRHAMMLNPFATVRSQRYRTDGKTPEITIGQARELLASVDLSTLAGLRDRAVLGTLIYTGARVGAVARLRLGDLHGHGDGQQALRFLEKNGKDREIPVRHDLTEWLAAYLSASGIADDGPEAPLYRAALSLRPKRGHPLSNRPMSAHLIRIMVKRRLKKAGLPTNLRPHSFRVLVVTDLLSQRVPLEEVQYLAGHSNPQTTQLYDRRRRRVTRNIVERISV